MVCQIPHPKPCVQTPILTTTALPAFHLRRQLCRRRPRHALPQIILRPGTPSLHTAHVEIPHPQNRAHRQPRRKATKQPRGGAGGDDAGIRLERPAAEQHQEAEGHGNVQGQETRDGFAGQGTEDEDTGEFWPI